MHTALRRPTILGGPTICVVSRYDTDKGPLVELLKALWAEQSRSRMVRWIVIGDGKRLDELKQSAMSMERAVGGRLVSFTGWLPQQRITDYAKNSEVCIASGRGAMQSLAVGTPTIGAASVGLAPALKSKDLPKAAYSNFGGLGADPRIDATDVWRMIEEALHFPEPDFAVKASEFITTTFDQNKVDKQLISIYRDILAEHPR